MGGFEKASAYSEMGYLTIILLDTCCPGTLVNIGPLFRGLIKAQGGVLGSPWAERTVAALAR